jgi:hypothetical protein
MSVTFKLTHHEPRLVYLALVYHLGRPGSELDAKTRRPREHGMRDLEASLRDQLAGDALIELDDDRYGRLLSAMHGCVNELRVYHMRNGAESTVAAFTSTARSLFPAIVADPEEALAVAESMMMLRRRLERAVKRQA